MTLTTDVSSRPRALASCAGRARRALATTTGRAVLAVAGVALAASVVPTGEAAHAQEVRAITLPVDRASVGKVRWTDTFGQARSGGRPHLGVDMMGVKMIPVVAARSGQVVWGRYDNAGGNYVRIRDDEGWEYQYIHLNNDTPGTDDGQAACPQAFSAKLCQNLADGGRLAIGTPVAEGEVIGYMGDSGNAESTSPHLHFEVWHPLGDGTAEPIDPTPSVDAALARLQGRPAPVANPSPAGPPPLAAPDQPGWADHLYYELWGRWPSAVQRQAIQADQAADGTGATLARWYDPSAAAPAVDRLYLAFFLRHPDTGGLRYWVGRLGAGVRLDQVAESFATSAEYRARYQGTSFGPFLDQLYRDVLGRPADSGGRAYWLGQLASGKVTRGSIVAWFTESAELKARSAVRSELVATQLVRSGAAPTDADEARWSGLRAGADLPTAIDQWFTT